jgi:hypothetical protein
MQRTVKVVTLVKWLVVLVLLVASYAIGHYNGTVAGYTAGSDATLATVQDAEARLVR